MAELACANDNNGVVYKTANTQPNLLIWPRDLLEVKCVSVSTCLFLGVGVGGPNLCSP